MSAQVEGYYIPVLKDSQIPCEVKRVKILTGKYKGQIKDFCHFLNEGSKVVVRIGAGHRLVYNTSSVEFVESEWVLKQQVWL